MTFNYKKYKENGKENSCVLYALHPDIVQDEFLKENLQKCVDYIRENYDMEVFTKIWSEVIDLSEKEIQKKIMEQSGTIAKVLDRGDDIEIKKTPSGVSIKKVRKNKI